MSEPLRVLELGSGVSAAYAAKLLGDHGADVIKVEPPEGDSTRRRGPFPGDAGDPERSGLFLAINLNKRGVCLDLDSQPGRASLDGLVSWADIVVHNFPRQRAKALGLDPSTLEAKRPDLVVLSITPFGNTGPYADFTAEELTVTNAGGWANLCPNSHQDPELPPLKIFGHQCGLMAGIAGALAALAVHRDARRSGVGDYIDFSEQEYVASVLEAGIPIYSYPGMVLLRYHPRGLIPWGTFDAKDGPIFLVCVEQDQWERLVEFMGRPEWAELEIFADNRGRAENQDVLHGFIQEFIGRWNVFDLYHAAQKHRICFSPVMSYAQLADDRHLRARDFFVTVDDPTRGAVEYLASPVMTTSGRAPIRRPAPRLGEHTETVLANAAPSQPTNANAGARRPLEGIRVLDLTWVWAGTFGSMNLAHLGADVIRFESEQRPDLYRRAAFIPPGMEPGLNRSGMFNQWNQGKKSVAVDLQDPRGIEIVKAFVAESDVVMQNFATGVMERLGLGYEELKRINPRIILASISGYGQSGPYREYMGYGPATPALTGLSAVSGFVGEGPEEFGLSMPDPTAGITAAWAVVSALERRERTGEGDHIDVTLWEATAVLGVEAWMQYAFDGTQPEPMGNRDPWMAPHGVFRCAGEDDWLSIACTDEDAWLRLCTIIDPALADDPRFLTLSDRKANEDALEAIVSEWTRERDRWEITQALQAAGIAAFPSLTCKDIVEDPHLNERGFIERLAHPEVGARAHAGIPWRLARRPNGVRMPAPCLGADTETLLADVLGYDATTIAELRDAKVLY
jgi:crotonobetainyl-CoA:carnitine CoA-transferase CaiB-like acyl-CoA transferase